VIEDLNLSGMAKNHSLVMMRWSDIEAIDCRPGINVVPNKLQGRLRIWVPFTQELQAKMAGWERRQAGFILTKPDGEPFTRARI
jgi:hypothetical protein